MIRLLFHFPAYIDSFCNKGQKVKRGHRDRLSFGFVNTIVVLVLMVPFHEPILALKKRIIEEAKKFKDKLSSDSSD